MSDKIRTVRLELLRAGPPHNQLLSPLTSYLGLCGDHGAKVVHVAWEHRHFMRRLEQLRYPERGEVTDKAQALRQARLDELAADIARLLAAVPGLSASQAGGAPGRTLTHLEIVHSAAELALLPYELARVPEGFPGTAGDWLSLDSSAPVCVTRTMRGVSGRDVRWPRRPRILFVAAAPRGMTVPLEPHTRALLAAVQPWLEPYDRDRPQALRRSVEGHLTVLPRASIAEVERVSAEQAFTHVHVLAHGVPDESSEGRPYGVALHAAGPGDEVEVVTGRRFAAALRNPAAGMPTVATLASCDSGNVGDVVFSGASFAHELHQSGIPLVVASQYPLSFAGSVLMVGMVYERLLWGEDPRRVLMDLRHKLFALHAAKTHDWASLVAYAALPPDLASQLEAVRYRQARRSIDTRLDWIDRELDESDSASPLAGDRLEGLFARVDEATSRLPDSASYRTEITGLRGSAHKRKAQALFRQALRLEAGEATDGRQQALDRMWRELQQARRRYREAARNELAPTQETELLFPTLLHWVLTQFLSINAVLGRRLLPHHWHAALLSARAQLEGGEEDRIWAHGSLAELYVLPLAHPEDERPVSAEHALRRIREHAKGFAELAPPAVEGEFSPTFSTLRQFRRYRDWWGHPLFEAHLEKSDVRRTSWEPLREAVGIVISELETL